MIVTLVVNAEGIDEAMGAHMLQPVPESLTERELEILHLIAEGLSNREIGLELVVSLETVKWYNKQIYSKLGVGSRTQAIARARELNLLNGESKAPASPEVRAPHNLPAQVTSFVGRERELPEVKGLLADNRLLTLTGSGGTGKSRLALQIAEEVADWFAQGVCFVGLETLSDPKLVPDAIAQALGLVCSPGEPLSQTLQRTMHDRDMLLVLDNLEHLMEAAPLVSDLLAAAPKVKVLATSREVLRLYGEHEYQVLPLAVPDLKRRESPAEWSQVEAVALFVERARAARPGFELTEQNAPAVAEICVRLDGLPLAIELAAARMKLFAPQALLQRLTDRLGELTGGSRDLPARQQTLRSTIDWSYDLLDDAEKRLFACLTVFSGGCTLEAVEAVCGAGLPVDLLEGVASLVDKSLVLQEEDGTGEVRFRMLQTMRAYGWERLEQSGEADALRRRHAEYYATLAERANGTFRGRDQETWFDRLTTEHDNLHDALAWAFTAGEAEIALRLTGSLGFFWYMEGHYAEGMRWSEHALEYVEEASPAVRAQALRQAGVMAFGHHNLTLSKRLLQESLATYRELGDRHNAAYSKVFLAGQSIGILEEYEEALALAEEGIAELREWDDKPAMAQALNIVGELTRLYGDYERAKTAYEECLALCRETGEMRRIVFTYHNLGFIAQHMGDPNRAEALFKESMRLGLDLDFKVQTAGVIAALAGPAIARGQYERAVRLTGASQALYRAIGAVPQPGDQPEYDRNLAVAREKLDEASFQAALAEGRAMTNEQAVSYAMSEDASDR